MYKNLKILICFILGLGLLISCEDSSESDYKKRGELELLDSYYPRNISLRSDEFVKNPAGSIKQKKVFDRVSIYEYVLSNGMRVIFKKEKEEDSEITFKAFALGGYGELPLEQQSSAKLSRFLLGDSRFNALTQTNFTRFLTYSNVEMNVEISPYSRSVVSLSQERYLQQILQAFHLIFMEEGGTPELFRSIQENLLSIHSKAKPSLLQQAEAYRGYMNGFKQVSSSDITLEDIENASYEEANDFWLRVVGDPSDFTVVILGNKDPKVIEELIVKYLASIPAKKVKKLSQNIQPRLFTSGISSQKIIIPDQTNYKTVYTLPLQKQLSYQELYSLRFVCYLLEDILEKKFQALNKNASVFVTYEQVYAPLLDPMHLVIRVESEKDSRGWLHQIVLETIDGLRNEGPTEKEFSNLVMQMEKMLHSMQQSNHCWLSNLFNLYLLHPDPNPEVLLEFQKFNSIESVKNFLFLYISPLQYSELLTTPQ